MGGKKSNRNAVTSSWRGPRRQRARPRQARDSCCLLLPRKELVLRKVPKQNQITPAASLSIPARILKPRRLVPRWAAAPLTPAADVSPSAAYVDCLLVCRRTRWHRKGSLSQAVKGLKLIARGCFFYYITCFLFNTCLLLLLALFQGLHTPRNKKQHAAWKLEMVTERGAGTEPASFCSVAFLMNSLDVRNVSYKPSARNKDTRTTDYSHILQMVDLMQSNTLFSFVSKSFNKT